MFYYPQPQNYYPANKEDDRVRNLVPIQNFQQHVNQKLKESLHNSLSEAYSPLPHQLISLSGSKTFRQQFPESDYSRNKTVNAVSLSRQKRLDRMQQLKAQKSQPPQNLLKQRVQNSYVQFLRNQEPAQISTAQPVLRTSSAGSGGVRNSSGLVDDWSPTKLIDNSQNNNDRNSARYEKLQLLKQHRATKKQCGCSANERDSKPSYGVNQVSLDTSSQQNQEQLVNSAEFGQTDQQRQNLQVPQFLSPSSQQLGSRKQSNQPQNQLELQQETTQMLLDITGEHKQKQKQQLGSQSRNILLPKEQINVNYSSNLQQSNRVLDQKIEQQQFNDADFLYESQTNMQEKQNNKLQSANAFSIETQTEIQPTSLEQLAADESGIAADKQFTPNQLQYQKLLQKSDQQQIIFKRDPSILSDTEHVNNQGSSMNSINSNGHSRIKESISVENLSGLLQRSGSSVYGASLSQAAQQVQFNSSQRSKRRMDSENISNVDSMIKNFQRRDGCPNYFLRKAQVGELQQVKSRSKSALQYSIISARK